MEQDRTGQPRHARHLGTSSAGALLCMVILLGLLAACGSPAAPAPAVVETATGRAPEATTAPAPTPTPEVETTAAVTSAEAMAETVTKVVTETATQTVTATSATPAATAADAGAFLVVQFDDSRTLARPISLTAPISGLAALQQSGLDVVTSTFAWGTGVCSIEGVGCPAEDCFCGGDLFWNYAFWDGVAWQSYPAGPDATVISATGSIEGWRWGTFDEQGLPAPQALAAQAALGWLERGQMEDGGYGGVGASIEALLAVAANRLDADRWRTAEEAPSLLSYVLEDGAAYSRQGVAEAGKLAVALAGAEACWPAEAVRPQAYYSETVGALSSDAGFLAWGILGTLALGEETPAGSVAYLTGLALPEGGWEWSPGWGRDTNTTALAIQTLLAAGTPVSATEIISGLAYLQAAQDASGGIRYGADTGWEGAADANSTAYALQALAAAGQSPYDPAWQVDGVGMVDFLLALQQANGGLAWQPGQEANLSATVQAVPALLEQPFPLRRAALETCAGGAQ